jgi:hypothetical protein
MIRPAVLVLGDFAQVALPDQQLQHHRVQLSQDVYELETLFGCVYLMAERRTCC